MKLFLFVATPVGINAFHAGCSNRKISSFLFLLLMVAGSGFSQQRLQENYTPLKSSGLLPPVFTQKTRDVVKQDITNLKKNKERDRSIKSSFLTASNYEIEKIVRSGEMLMNDEITAYLNLVMDELLKDHPGWRKQIQVYTLKSPVVNAYSYDKGYIFVDIGLVAKVESEAQLAYILCHEITHFTRQHSINSYVNNRKIDKNKRSSGTDNNYETRLIEKCQYSKESESEADLEGFKLFEKSRYAIKEAENSFEILQYAHLPFEMVRLKKSFFETPAYRLPDSYFLKEEAPIRDNSHEDDALHTHPNTAKRRMAVIAVAAGADTSGRLKSVIGQKRFEYIRDLARMETCRLYLKRRDYPNALYAAYILSAKYPNNQYLAEIISKSLYGITLYRNNLVDYHENSYLPKGIGNYNDIEGFPQQLYYLIDQMPSDEWLYISLNYVYRSHKKFPANNKISQISDSLFHLLIKTGSNTNGFARVNDSIPAATRDSMADGTQQPKYYRNMFTDLFVSDKQFAEKFPAATATETEGEGFKTYSKYKYKKERKDYKEKKKRPERKTLQLEKLLVLEPFYLKIDRTKASALEHLRSDEKQEEYVSLLSKYAAALDVSMTMLDPGRMEGGEMDKINDYTVFTDWIDEFMDSNHSGQLILNTDADHLIATYGTPYVLRTGFVSLRTEGKKKRTFFINFIVDMKNSKIIYKRYTVFKTRDYGDLVHAKTYQLLFDIKHPIKLN